MLVPDEIKSIMQSKAHRELNAEKVGIRGTLKDLYVHKIAHLKNVEKVYQLGNGGSGYIFNRRGK